MLATKTINTKCEKTREAVAGITEMASKTVPAQLLTNPPICTMTFTVSHYSPNGQDS